MVNILSSNEQLKESFLKTQEAFFNFKFPDDYRNFLLKFNGGVAENKVFLFKNAPEDGSILDRLFGFTPDKNQNILLYFKRYQDRIPENTFPIGYDPGGNIILLSVKGPDRGKVYFWDHEREADPSQGEKPSYDNLTLIADSFEEFINNLKAE